MQKISEILNSPTAPAETGARASNRPTKSDAGNWIWSNDERLAGRPGVPEPVPCEFCGALRYHKGIPLGNRILWPPYGAERCTCPEAVAAYEKAKAEREAAEAAAAKAEEEKKMRDRIKRIVGESGMGDRFLRRIFFVIITLIFDANWQNILYVINISSSKRGNLILGLS